MMRPVKKVGAYAKLAANYAADDAIMEAGEAAELLFVRALAFCATSDSDGFITEAQLSRYVGAGMRDAKKRADRLVSVGLWSREASGYQVRSWVKFHDTTEEKGRKLRADRERKRAERGHGDGIQEPVQPESERTDTGQGSGFPVLIHNTAVQNKDTDSDGQESGKPTARQLAAAFDEFWKAYPRREGKAAAQRNYERAVRRGADPAAILAAAKTYAQQVHGTEAKFVKMPQGWLTDGRWDDELPVAAGGTKPWWERR